MARERELVVVLRGVEAHPVRIDAAQHDHQLALTSHLPQAVASLLAHHLAHATPPGATFGPGARDATRLAASEPALWTEIFLMNRDELLPALRSLEEPLGELERALETGNARGVTAWLTRAAEWRRQADACKCRASSGRRETRASRIAS